MPDWMQISVAPAATASSTRRAESVPGAPVGVDARREADLGRSGGDGLVARGGELGLGVLVGVGRAPALAEPAERAADDADVGDVDVSVDDEGDGLPRLFGAQLVRRLAEVLDRLGAALGEQRGELVGRERHAVAAPGDGAGHEVGADDPLLAPAAATPRDERPVLDLDDVEHALGDPVGVEVLRVDAEPLRERDALAGELL